MLQGLVTFAFDGVAAQIINSWRACRLHCLPPSFSLFTSLFPSFSYPPLPLLVSACPVNQSGWQCAAVREPVRVITHFELGQDLDGLSRQQERRASGRFHQSNSCPLLFFCFYLFFLHRISTFKVEREGTRPDTDIVNLLSRWVTMMGQHLCYIYVPEKSICLWVCFRVCTNDCFLCCK